MDHAEVGGTLGYEPAIWAAQTPGAGSAGRADEARTVVRNDRRGRRATARRPRLRGKAPRLTRPGLVVGVVDRLVREILVDVAAFVYVDVFAQVVHGRPPVLFPYPRG